MQTHVCPTSKHGQVVADHAVCEVDPADHVGADRAPPAHAASLAHPADRGERGGGGVHGGRVVVELARVQHAARGGVVEGQRARGVGAVGHERGPGGARGACMWGRQALTFGGCGKRIPQTWTYN